MSLTIKQGSSKITWQEEYSANILVGLLFTRFSFLTFASCPLPNSLLALLKSSTDSPQYGDGQVKNICECRHYRHLESDERTNGQSSLTSRPVQYSIATEICAMTSTNEMVHTAALFHRCTLMNRVPHHLMYCDNAASLQRA